MGSLGNSDHKSPGNVDFAPPQTQPFDSQLSPPSSPGEKDGEWDAKDAFETPLVSIAGETQVLNFAGETQALDDPDWNENMATQLLDGLDTQVAVDSDGEGTEVLSDSDELSDVDYLARRCNNHSLNGKKNEHTSFSRHGQKGLMEPIDALTDKQHSPGLGVFTAAAVTENTPGPNPGPARFTSVRAASLRASGLAARNRALKETCRESNAILSSNQLPELDTGTNNVTDAIVDEEADCACDMEVQNNNGRIGGPTVRKLFMEDSQAENKRIAYNGKNSVDGEDLLQFPICDNGPAGLSYVDSQEPGELSQANALEFVDNLIQNNYLESDNEVGHTMSTEGKLKPVSSAKGSQRLAKKTNDRTTVGETWIFDWDDNREDEGGGDIFVRKKEEFLGTASCGRSFTKTQKPKGLTLDESTGNKEQPDADNKRMVHSDSRLLLLKSNLDEKTIQELKFVKNLANDFAEQASVDFPREKFEVNVGFDTQMAADALETLCNREGIINHGANDSYLAFQSNSDGLPKGSRGKNQRDVSLTQSTRKKRGCLSVKGATRQSEKTKRIDAKSMKEPPVTKKRSRTLKRECDKELLMTRPKKGKSNAGGCLNNHVSESMNKKTSKINQQREAEVGCKRSQLDESHISHSITKLRAGSSVKKQHLEEKVRASASIARQTRQSRTNHLLDIGVLEENTARTTALEASKVLNGEKESSNKDAIRCKNLEPAKSNQHEKLLSKLSALGNSMDTISYPRGRRSRRSLLPAHDQHQNKDKMGTGDAAHTCDSANMNGKITQKVTRAKARESTRTKNDANPSSSTKNMDSSIDISPIAKSKPSNSACNTPSNCMTPVNAASPVCMGDEYLKQSCKRNLSKTSLMREISSLNATERERIPAMKDSRKRRDVANVRVLFSHHLDEDIIKQQKKILVRLGSSIASSILDATHFVTDRFVRTRNMLEAIASGKPVVTHLWLESVGQANYYIDEDAYILRDNKKEKEFGFSMPISLARARQLPLFEGRRVLITPNVKPGKETISSLVKAVHGQAIERTGRSALKDDKIPDDLLILSCEEDYAICEPFLEKGAAVYSSELLLNGIVTQKLEFERYRLFVDHVKRTRSTIWLRAGNNFLPVTKHK